MKCIYSDQILNPENFSVDHFLPWSFVTHDLLWNLIPTIRNINSSKSDNLPDFDMYFPNFAAIQYDAFINNTKLNSKTLEDFTDIFKLNFVELLNLNQKQFEDKLKEQMKPLFQIAQNMGFTADWKY